MTIASALAIFAAVLAMQLSRGSLAVSPTPFLLVGLLACGVILLLRMLFGRLRRRIASPRILAGLVVAAALGTLLPIVHWTGMPPVEELLAGSLVSIASWMWILGNDARRTHGWIVGVSLVTCLLLLPGVDFTHRTPVVASAVSCVVFWLVCDRRRSAAGGDGSRAVDLPWAVGLALVAATGVIGAERLVKPTDLNPSYAGWISSSGGGSGSEFSRRGVGDGPDELTSASANSVGFDQGDVFSDSNLDSLYDLWIENYGEPMPASRFQKSVALLAEEVREAVKTDRENLRAGRRFEIRRETPRRRETPDSTDAAARLWIRGPLPAYLPMATFDRFDGDSWTNTEPRQASIPVRLIDDWMEPLDRPISPALLGLATYEVRIGSLGGRVLPMPKHVSRFRLGQVRQPDFFALDPGGLLALSRRDLPPGAVLDVECKTLSGSALFGVEVALPIHTHSRFHDTTGMPTELSSLAERWSAGHPRGWLQVEQVLHRLRESASFDPSHRTPPGVDPLLDLTHGSRTGTDYQFATVAALMLRSLSYPARVVSGFYADPSKLDHRSGSVPLGSDALHFWIELRLADGTWVAVDPTPGFPMLSLPVPLTHRLLQAWNSGIRWVSRHGAWLLAVMSLAGLGVLFRKQLVDVAITAACRLRGYPLVTVARAIETRARLAGRPRRPHQPLGTWFGSLGASPGFVAGLNQAMYSDEPRRVARASHDARDTLERLTVNRIKQS